MMDSHDSDSGKRYKMVTKVDIPGKGTHMAVAFSPDGKDWVGDFSPVAGTQSSGGQPQSSFWNEDEGCYMLLSRVERRYPYDHTEPEQRLIH